MGKDIQKPRRLKIIQNAIISAEEAVSGIHYTGIIKLNSSIFEYSLKWPSSIAVMSAKLSTGALTLDEAMKTTIIEVKVGNQPIELSWEEKDVFFSLGSLVSYKLFRMLDSDEQEKETMNKLATILGGVKIKSGLAMITPIDVNHPAIVGLLRKAEEANKLPPTYTPN